MEKTSFYKPFRYSSRFQNVQSSFVESYKGVQSITDSTGYKSNYDLINDLLSDDKSISIGSNSGSSKFDSPNYDKKILDSISKVEVILRNPALDSAEIQEIGEALQADYAKAVTDSKKQQAKQARRQAEAKKQALEKSITERAQQLNQNQGQDLPSK